MKTSSHMNLAVIGFAALLNAQTVFAGPGHKAHVHGTAELDIAVEGQALTVMFESPADSIYGFEHEAKTEKDIKARDAAVDMFKTHVATLFALPETLGCIHSVTKLEAFDAEEDDDHGKADAKSKKGGSHKGTHGDFEAEVKITCKSPLKDQTMDVGLFDKFSGLSKIKVQIVGEKSSSLRLTKKSNKIKF